MKSDVVVPCVRNQLRNMGNHGGRRAQRKAFLFSYVPGSCMCVSVSLIKGWQ